MRYLYAIIAIGFLSSCATSNISEARQSGHRTYKARVTYYRPGEDKYGRRIACDSHMRATEGRTVAASRSLPFGTKLQIPSLKGILGDGMFVVQDRGRDVERKRASRGKYPVIDIFVATKKKYHWLINHIEPVLDVLEL